MIAVQRILEDAIAARVFPGAVVEVGRAAGAIGTITVGAQAYAYDSPAADARTIYDLASLTKVLAAAPLTAHALTEGRIRLNDRVRRWIASWTGEDRQIVTIRDLLEHASGLPAHRPYYQTRSGRAAFELAICEEALAYLPRTAALYSDPGFMLLGFALENAGNAPLDRQFDRWRDRELGADAELRYRPPHEWFARIAPTEDLESGEERRGTVHDENAAALGGVAAHAGLFGTAAAVGASARWWLRSTHLAPFGEKSSVPGSSRALAWDTMLPTSSCGTRLSPTAIGHTGFTGTSLWIDPERDLYVVLLSNRVHPTRQGDGIQAVRRAVHDAIVTDLEASGLAAVDPGTTA